MEAQQLRMQTTLGVAEQPDLVSKLNFVLMRELNQRAVALKE
jgi:hypothetical protein